MLQAEPEEMNLPDRRFREEQMPQGSIDRGHSRSNLNSRLWRDC